MPDLLEKLQSLGYAPCKVSTKQGGEYASGCPACGDGGKGRNSDRFHVWPHAETSGLGSGRFWCRQCGANGDNIAFMQRFFNMDFQAACMDLGISLPNRSGNTRRRFTPSPVMPQNHAAWQPRTYGDPSPVWQEKAGNLLADCRDRLAHMPAAMSWLEERGITAPIASTYRLGFNQSSKDGDRYRPRSLWGLQDKAGGKNRKLWIPRGWVIPSFGGSGQLQQLRIRRMPADIAAFADNIKYLPLDGSSMATMVLHPDADVFVAVECGFDAILIAGALHGKIGTVTTWSASARPDKRAHRILSRASLILNGLDFDHAGEKEQAWWGGVYQQNHRLPKPQDGVNDPGEAYAAGVDIREWIVDALPRGVRIRLGFERVVSKPVQVNQEKKPVDVDVQQDPPPVVEVELSNGTIIYLTDDQEQWQQLTAEGKPVFSRNEMARLKEATSTMSDEERLEAAMKAVEVKQMFGGYIRRGKSF